MTRSRLFRHFVPCLFGAWLGWTPTLRAELSRAEIADLFAQGKDLFRQANEAVSADREKATDLYQKSALRFERMVQEGEVHNGKLFYNIGNIYFRMDDIGRAILNYRRAEQYIPNDPNLKQNLDYARQRRLDRIEDQQATRILRTLLFWHYSFPARLRQVLFVVSFLLVWVGAALRLFVRRRFLSWCIGASAAMAILFFASLLADTISFRQNRPGVILHPEVIARKGDSETYEPSFKEPLHAGTEFMLVENRGGWLQVELADARRCWLPAKAVEFAR
jgi:tetratricopeptide (TPR) repeat protein